MLQADSLPSEPQSTHPSGSSVHGILQAKILEWVAVSFSRYRGVEPVYLLSPALAGRFFTTSASSEAPKTEYVLLNFASKKVV